MSIWDDGLRLTLSNKAVLELHILYGEAALEHYFDALKEEAVKQVGFLKTSGYYDMASTDLFKQLTESSG